MGCYGMGLGRLMAAIVEIHRDERGIIWPKEVAPFQIHLIQIENNKKVKAASKKIFNDLKRAGLEVLYDDREDKTAGEKFAEADLIGIPLRMVVSEKTLAEKSVEVKKRSEGKTKLIKINEIKNYARYTK
jgi:prolyl-tRNA synthetase